MERRANDEQMWELNTNPSRGDRRHSSSASSSSQSSEGKQNPDGRKGRRTRPSVTSLSSQLPTVREQKERRVWSWGNDPNRPEDLPRLTSDETVVSSKQVLKEFRRVAARDPDREKKRQQKSDEYRAENHGPRSVYEQLKKLADDEAQSEKSWILWLGLKGKAPLPALEKLLDCARHYYPPRVRSPDLRFSLSF